MNNTGRRLLKAAYAASRNQKSTAQNLTQVPETSKYTLHNRPNENYGRQSNHSAANTSPSEGASSCPTLIVRVLAIDSQWNCSSQAAVLQSVEHLEVTASLTPLKVAHILPETIYTSQGHQPL